jgi:hypothetical protein
VSAAERCSLVDNQAFRFPTTLSMTLSFAYYSIDLDVTVADVLHSVNDVVDDSTALSDLRFDYML